MPIHQVFYVTLRMIRKKMSKNAFFKPFQPLASCVLDRKAWILLSGAARRLLIPLLTKNLCHLNAAWWESYSGELKVLSIFIVHVTEPGMETYV